MRMPMIVMTTSNSTRVKPAILRAALCIAAFLSKSN
jgi:hypothetical protein